MLLRKIFHQLKVVAAKNYLRFFKDLEIIGVTGSVGKTTTKEAIASVLEQKFRVIKTSANIDPIFNIPNTILKLRPGDEKLILELGVEYPGEMDKYLSWIKPSIGVVTQISWTHTQFLGDIEGVAKEKGKLIKALPKNGWQVLNFDDPKTRDLKKIGQAKTFFFGLDKKNCHLWAQDINPSDNGVSFNLVYPQNHEQTLVRFQILGRHNVYCALAAAAVGLILGLRLEEIKNGLEKLRPQPSRLNVFNAALGLKVIDDSYNASPVGVVAALKTLAEFPGRKKIAVLGEMKELGGYSQTGHQEVGEIFADLKLDYLIYLGEQTRFIAAGASEKGVKKENIFQAESIKEAVEILRRITRPGDVVLVKGSRFSHMERVIPGLQGKNLGCNLLTCKKYQSCVACKNLE